MAISEYYSSFEEALAKENVPLEIKYLAVVESALNLKQFREWEPTGLAIHVPNRRNNTI
jgi:membrane-bound lytic murein transglycosylase D